MTETHDEYHVRSALKVAIAEAGGAIMFAGRHHIRLRDLDLAVTGMLTIVPPKILDAIGYELHVRYRKKTSEKIPIPAA